MIELIALKKYGKYRPGDTFKEQPGKAKLLVAIKSARYLTRDMVADREPEPIVLQQEQEIKRGRGRPRLNTNIEE